MSAAPSSPRKSLSPDLCLSPMLHPGLSYGFSSASMPRNRRLDGSAVCRICSRWAGHEPTANLVKHSHLRGLGAPASIQAETPESRCFWRESSASSQDSTLFNRVQHVLTQLLLHWVDDFVMLIPPPNAIPCSSGACLCVRPPGPSPDGLAALHPSY